MKFCSQVLPSDGVSQGLFHRWVSAALRGLRCFNVPLPVAKWLPTDPTLNLAVEMAKTHSAASLTSPGISGTRRSASWPIAGAQGALTERGLLCQPESNPSFGRILGLFGVSFAIMIMAVAL